MKSQGVAPTFKTSDTLSFVVFEGHKVQSEVSIPFRVYFTDIAFGVSTQTRSICSWQPLFASVKTDLRDLKESLCTLA